MESQLRAELKAKGLSADDIRKELKKAEPKFKEADNKLFIERQKEFPNLVAKMNEELEPYGMKITSKYKVDGYGELKPNTAPKWIKEMKPEVVKPETKLTTEEMERLDWLKDQVSAGEKHLKSLSKDNPQYDGIKRMIENNKKEIEKLKKKMK